MPCLAVVGNCLPCRGADRRRTGGEREDAIAPAAGVNSAVFVLGGVAGSNTIGSLVAVEQASLSGITAATEGARTGAAHNIGGVPAVSVVTILEGAGAGGG